MTRRVAIVGGGLAGLTCAKSMIDAGLAVSVWEAEPILGGRASTFRDADGDWVEQGLHLFLGTYTEFRKLLDEIGQPPDDILFWMSQVRLQDPGGVHAVYGTNPVTAPLKTLLSGLGQNDFLGIKDKLTLAPLALSSLKTMDMLEKYDDRSIVQFWKECGGTTEVLERFLRPYCRAIQFTDAEDFSAYNFLGWMHHVAYHPSKASLGGYLGPRDETIFAPLGRWLTDRGAAIRTGVALERILYSQQDHKVQAMMVETGERVEADYYVCALPAWCLSKVLPPDLMSYPFFQNIANLPTAPAISVQIWFDRKVVDHSDFTVIAREAVPVYQDQSTNAYPYDKGSRISATISPADEYLTLNDDALVKMTLDALAKVQTTVASAQVVKAVVLRHEKHLLRPRPGVMTARPTQTTPVPNLFLAGDWTKQDYFGSQEGAVRSGRLAAEAILNHLNAL